MDQINRDDALLHVYDLPQLHTRPSAANLLSALDLLTLHPSDFSSKTPAPRCSESGVPAYLISIISSPLSWISSDETRDAVYAAAAARLSERSGRNALPSVTRQFLVADHVRISLHEPSLTEDNLGLKTWASSLLLARRLPSLRAYLPTGPLSVLELGAGTGLVGIAAACMWGAQVVLTDLPEIVGNLQKNVQGNEELMQLYGGRGTALTLDWSDGTQNPRDDAEKFPVIVAADPIYSPDHPAMLVDTVGRWLAKTAEARFIVELPLRVHYVKEREALKSGLTQLGLKVEIEGEETGFDDWQSTDGERTEVRCWWSVWKPDGSSKSAESR